MHISLRECTARRVVADAACVSLIVIAFRVWRGPLTIVGDQANFRGEVVDRPLEKREQSHSECAAASEPYMTACEVVDYMTNLSEWGSKKKDEVTNRGKRTIPRQETFDGFRNVAKSGGISVLGRLNGTCIHQSIPSTFWLIGTFDMNTIMRRHISQTAPAIPNERGIPFYKDLQISRADVYRAWPRKP
jgi:hypothetical protein